MDFFQISFLNSALLNQILELSSLQFDLIQMVFQLLSAVFHLLLLLSETVDLLSDAFQNLVELRESFGCFGLLFAVRSDFIPQFFNFLEDGARLLDLVDFCNHLTLGLTVESLGSHSPLEVPDSLFEQIDAVVDRVYLLLLCDDAAADDGDLLFERVHHLPDLVLLALVDGFLFELTLKLSR